MELLEGGLSGVGSRQAETKNGQSQVSDVGATRSGCEIILRLPVANKLKLTSFDPQNWTN